jgi:hypothetical protein
VQPLNYSRQALAALEPQRSQWERVSTNSLAAAAFATAFVTVTELLPRAEKFILPPGGFLLHDDKLKAIADDDLELRLPYPVTALEFADDQSEPIEFGTHRASRRIVLARHVGDDLEVHVVAFAEHKRQWTFSPPVHIPVRGWPQVRADGLVGISYKVGNYADDSTVNALADDMHRECAALMQFLNVLACSNVTTQPVERRHKLNKNAQRRGAAPFDEYRILVLRNATEAHGQSAPREGESRQPREHLRRGHIRRYQSGQRIWINSMVVNAGIGGKVQKDYAIRTAS